MIRAAPIRPDGKPDWERQVSMILTFDETLRALTVTLDHLPQAWGQGSARQTGRWFEVIHQGKTLCLGVAGGGAIHRVEITPGDAFRLSALLLAQVRKQIPAGVDVAGNPFGTDCSSHDTFGHSSPFDSSSSFSSSSFDWSSSFSSIGSPWD